MSQRWTFSGTQIIVSEDSDWKTTRLDSIAEPIDANISTVQTAGYKSYLRDISGWLLAANEKTALDSLLQSGSTFTMVDDQARSYTVTMMSFEVSRVRNIDNWYTTKFNMTVMRV